MVLRLTIAKPCRAVFADMEGDDRTRFCRECGKQVFDLSERTEAEARALLQARAGERTCARFARDASGAPLFKAAAVAAALSMAACAAHAPAQPPAAAPSEQGDRDMGDVIPDARDVCDEHAQATDDDGCPQQLPAGDGGAADADAAVPAETPARPPSP